MLELCTIEVIIVVSEGELLVSNGSVCVGKFVTERRCDRGDGGDGVKVGVLDIAPVDGAAIMLKICAIGVVVIGSEGELLAVDGNICVRDMM